jgi:hypothetical protein
VTAAVARPWTSSFAHVPIRRVIAAGSMAAALAIVTFAATEGNTGAAERSVTQSANP